MSADEVYSHFRSYHIKYLSKREFTFNTNAAEKLKEMKRRQSYSSYILQRVYISRGKFGEVLGFIDGGFDKVVDGVPKKSFHSVNTFVLLQS